VRARVSPPRARRLRGELSEVFTSGRRAGDGLRHAVLALDSDRRPHPGVLVRAAERAVGLTDYVLAERLFRAGCDAGAGFEAQLGLASVLSWMVRPAEAEAALATALASAATDAERLRAALFRALLLFFDHEDVVAAGAVLDRAQAEVGAPPAGTVLDSMRAVMATASGDVGRGARLAGAVLATRDTAPWAAAWASWGAAYARAWSGRGAPIVDLVARGVAAARSSLETLPLQNNIAFAEVLGVCLEGEPARASARTGWIREHPGSHAAGFSAMLEAYAELTRGHPATTIRLVHDVLPQLPGRGGGWTAFLAALLAHAHGTLGDAAAARHALDLAGRTAHAGIQFFDPHLELARAWSATAGGAAAEARGHLARAADRAQASGQSAVEVLVRHTRVCFGDRTQAPRLAALARELGGRAAPVAAAHAAALSASDDAGLLAVAAELEAAQRYLVAADAAAQAAVLARRDGRPGDAAAAAARAAELAEQCEGARTPALGAASSPLPLRDREREIALLAAAGLTNRAIAGRLQLSVRTVESHVYRACTRLGLADRAELAAAVRPRTAPAGLPGSPGTGGAHGP
jgi:DNA-binding NarL/FixJ family response regulator